MVATEYQLTQEEQDNFIKIEKEKCLKVKSNFEEINNGSRLEGYCPPIWDEIMCWNTTRAGETPVQLCPNYIMGFLPNRYAFKECLSNDTWFMKNSSYWTNYSQCFTREETRILNVDKSVNESFIEPYLTSLRIISEVGYSVSLLSLVIAFIILISIKRLRCPRNVLHMHLFASFIMRAFMSLLKDSLFKWGLGMTSDLLTREEGEYFNSQSEKNWSCRLITSVWQYFILANYSWILMEGLYLHNLIFLALFTDSSSITLYIALGWGLPVIFIVPWTICRIYLENEFCWTINGNPIIFLLIQGPVTAIVLVNFILFVNIAKVLLRKLQSSVSEETKTYRRWAKSTLVLIPLFGVHYMVLQGLQYNKRSTVELIWLFCDRIFTCFNGFFVALLYCFLNGEVRIELAKKWDHFSLQELLKRWHLTGRDSIFYSIRFLRNNRHQHPRGSCCSNSCTIDTIVHSGNRDKKNHVALHTTHVQCKHAIRDDKALSDMGDAPDCRVDSLQFKNGLSEKGKDRRWSSSDYDPEKNAIELKRMTSPDNIVNL